MTTDTATPITPQDLTVGSIVVAEYGDIWQVISLNDQVILRSLTHQVLLTAKYADLQPIPITAEWLERLGFYSALTDNSLYFCKTASAHVAVKGLDYFFGDDDYQAPILGVHHLQAFVWHHSRVWLSVNDIAV